MRRRVPALLLVLGLSLVIAGVVVLGVVNRPGAPVDVGWTAYTPLAEQPAYRSSLTVSFDDDDGWTVLWTGGHVLGALLTVAGLLVLTALGGWWLGRRASART